MSAGAYICSRDDLREFHYQFEAEPFDAGPEHRHGPAWSDSIAWTHCICFGAAARAVGPLLADVERLREQNKASSDAWQRRIAETESALTSTRALMREAYERHNAEQPAGKKGCGISGYGAAAAAAIIEENGDLRLALGIARDFITNHPAVSGTWPLLVSIIDDALRAGVSRGDVSREVRAPETGVVGPVGDVEL